MYEIATIHSLSRMPSSFLEDSLYLLDDELFVTPPFHPSQLGDQFDVFHYLMNNSHLARMDDIWFINNTYDREWIQGVELLYRRAIQQGKRLVLRDFSYLDYFLSPWSSAPAFSLASLDIISRFFRTIPLAILEHPLALWLDLSRIPDFRDRVDIEAFIKGYHRFAISSVEIGFVKIEDVLREPQNFIEMIGRKYSISLNGDQKKRFLTIFADTAREIAAARKWQHEETHGRSGISLQKAKPSFIRNSDYLQAVKILGYEKWPKVLL